MVYQQCSEMERSTTNIMECNGILHRILFGRGTLCSRLFRFHNKLFQSTCRFIQGLCGIVEMRHYQTELRYGGYIYVDLCFSS
jgi:hypothetical protein